MVYLVTNKPKLLSSGQLSGTGVASKTGEVEYLRHHYEISFFTYFNSLLFSRSITDLVMGSPDPVRLGDWVATLGALGPVQPDVVQLAEDLVILEETGGVRV